MATLVLTAVGNLVGGPIGGAIGSVLGQQIDQSLFAPKGRQGPRLGNLAVQTSAYGSDIPKIFGTMRIAGTVIWATDLIETRSTGGGGKGRPKTTSYAYSANFAVALSGRAILGVRRIWADGKLLRGVAGDFKTATGYRLHLGDEDQAVDPLIGSAEGADAPAFRGMAYAVFENFQLEDYGNRIPSLTFEVDADTGPVSVAALARTLAGPLVEAGESPLLGGFAASGNSVRGAVETLVDASHLTVTGGPEGGVHLSAGSGATVHVAAGSETEKREVTRAGSGSVPAEVTIAYYDAARDFQTGLQRASDSSNAARNSERFALPVALSAGEAKAMAERRLAARRAARQAATLSLCWRHATIRPGDAIAFSGDERLWRVRRTTFGPMTTTLDTVCSSTPAPAGLPIAAPGGGVTQPDIVHGPTTIRILEFPFATETDGKPGLFVAAAGVAPGWRRASLLASFNGGMSWAPLGSTAPAAVIGTALTGLSGAGSALFDLAGAVEVELLNAEMWLESATDTALLDGANLALLGDELFQFGHAQWLGGRRFRLSRLLRGRRGTEWAAAAHAVGDGFILLEPDTLLAFAAPEGSIGGSVTISANGVGDSTPVPREAPIRGANLRPPSPVHLSAGRLADGDIEIRWIRRSRRGWVWSDGPDVPVSEEREAYFLTMTGSGFTRTAMSFSSPHIYTLAQQVEDGLSGLLTIEVRQEGDHAPSLPATIVIA